MAYVLSTEKSDFMNKEIAIVSKIKLGQYGPYLNKNQFFVTYYSTNLVNSRADIGTGGIVEEIGPNSPLRFCKILNFPIYNLPDLKPDVNYDDLIGIDTNLDLNDIYVLPNTVKPVPIDYILVQIVGTTTELLFRVNRFSNNSVQTNDGYLIDLDLKYAGADLAAKIEPQVIDSFNCVYENIGTEDKCLIRTADYEKVSKIGEYFNDLCNHYRSLYFNPTTGDMLLSTEGVETPTYYYDMFLAKFINESEIYFKEFTNDTLYLSYDEFMQSNFEIVFKKSLWYAILKRDKTLLMPYHYFYETPVSKRYSPITLNRLPCTSTNLELRTDAITNPDTLIYVKQYFPTDLISSIIAGTLNENCDYLDEIIFNYMTFNDVNIDYEKILVQTFNISLKSYMYLPIICYILKQLCKAYFA
jgi:hypothetical protein